MAENGASSSCSSSLVKEKLVIVRVKRKLNQTRFDGFWLEINERPSKRALLDLSKLSISDSPAEKDQEEKNSKKLFVQLVDTITQSGSVENVLHSFLNDSNNSKETKIEARRKGFKQGKKPEESRQVARQKHEELARNARFEQIWRSRKATKDSNEESLREICHLYDVVQVDTTEQSLPKTEKNRIEKDDILCNYLSLLREYIPAAAEEIESDILSHASSEENYVYDLYTVENNDDTEMTDMENTYPLVRVDEDDFDDEYYDGPQSGYDTDDSNAEDNPLFDYPDEESEEDEDEDEERDSFDDFDEDEEYERQIVDFDDDNDE